MIVDNRFPEIWITLVCNILLVISMYLRQNSSKIFRFNVRFVFSEGQVNYNHGHNILSLFDALPNVHFTTSKTKHDY